MKTLILFACLTVCGVTAEVQLKLAPNVVTVTNEFKERETLIIWTNLPARYSGSLGENMIFRSVALKRVTFMEKETRTLKAFDVTDLHPDVCDYHRIDVNTQVRKAQDDAAAYQRSQEAGLAAWHQREAERQRRLAEEAAIRAENARLAAIEAEKQFQRDLELRKVEAEERKADAEMQKALNPEPGIIIQNQNNQNNVRRTGPIWFR